MSEARAAAFASLLMIGCDGPVPATQPGTSGRAPSEGTESTGAPESLEGSASLIDLAAFEKSYPDEDPFEDRPADVQCEFGFGLEDGFFEVETDLCHYGGFVQPSLAPIREGDTIDFLLLHENLVSSDPAAEVHLALAFGSEVVFETVIQIPTEANFVAEAWVSGSDVPAGTPIHLHLHNHGINSYRVSALSVTYSD